MRQSLRGGSYSLIDKNYNPCVDYWVSVLYKRLVGTEVLKVSGFLEFNRTVRTYAHCVKSGNSYGYTADKTVVLFVLNLNDADIEIKFSGSLNNTLLQVDVFQFTSATGDLKSGLVKLNGKVLEMLDDNFLPDLEPVQMKQPFVLPALSYAFFVAESDTVKCS